MKSLRYVKLRTFCPDPADLALMRNHNPLKEEVSVQPSQSFTTTFLQNFKTAVSTDVTNREPCVPKKYHWLECTLTAELERTFSEWNLEGWLAWGKTISLYKLPHPKVSTFQPWDKESEDAIAAVRSVVNKGSFWKELSTYYAEENQALEITQDNVSCVKSICKLHCQSSHIM